MPRNDFDGAWKTALDRYLQEFLALFFPAIHGDVDWSREPEALDSEFQQLSRGLRVRRHVDKLFKVHLRDGQAAWVLIHIEFQARHDEDFTHRLFVYHYRIVDRYQRPVTTLAVLGDPDPAWRPDRYQAEQWGCKVWLKFPVLKLIDLAPRLDELERSENLFALVVAAYLHALKTRLGAVTRKDVKLRLIRRLYDRGLSRNEIISCFEVIDQMLVLSQDLSLKFRYELTKMEEEKKVRYITSIERLGREEGRQEGRQEGHQEGREEGRREALRSAIGSFLEARFGPMEASLLEQLSSVRDLDSLARLVKSTALVDSVEEFGEELKRLA